MAGAIRVAEAQRDALNTPEAYYRELVGSGEDPDLAAAAVDAAFGFAEPPDPFSPDYEALGRESLPLTAGRDSSESAGLR